MANSSLVRLQRELDRLQAQELLLQRKEERLEQVRGSMAMAASGKSSPCQAFGSTVRRTPEPRSPQASTRAVARSPSSTPLSKLTPKSGNSSQASPKASPRASPRSSDGSGSIYKSSRKLLRDECNLKHAMLNNLLESAQVSPRSQHAADRSFPSSPSSPPVGSARNIPGSKLCGKSAEVSSHADAGLFRMRSAETLKRRIDRLPRHSLPASYVQAASAPDAALVKEVPPATFTRSVHLPVFEGPSLTQHRRRAASSGSHGNTAESDPEREVDASTGSRSPARSRIGSSGSITARSAGSRSPKRSHRPSSGSIDSTLMKSAIGNVSPGLDAKHPGRASAGFLLLQRLKDHLEFLEEHRRRAKEGASGNQIILSADGGLQQPDDGTDIVRSLFLDSMPEANIEIESVRQLVQVHLLKRFLRQVAEERASVEATFHGTRLDSLRGVWEKGLLPGMCATGAFGRGSYVAMHAGIAHQYAFPDTRGYRYMCVVLAVPGSKAIKGRLGEEPPVTAMDRLSNPTQYCLVDEARLYVSHLITYRVTNSFGGRVGGGWEDPFQKALSTAVVRSAQWENKSGVR